MRRNTCIIICSLLSLLLPTANARAGEVNLMVAASLKEVINELSDRFGKKNPGTKFIKNYGASGMLAKQIENAAPADLFISANPAWVDYLKQKKLLNEKQIETFAYNELVFAGKPEMRVRSLPELVKLERISIGSPNSVPAGTYAMEVFKTAGLVNQLEKKLVMAKDVRECLMYAERGEVAGAMVYRTDALQLGKIAKILFVVPQDLYSRVTYPMALTAAGSRKGDAAAFFGFLKSPEAKTVLAKHGFAIK